MNNEQTVMPSES